MLYSVEKLGPRTYYIPTTVPGREQEATRESHVNLQNLWPLTVPQMELSSGKYFHIPTRHYQHSKGQTMVPLRGDFTLLWMRSVLKWKLWTLRRTFAHRAALPFRHIVSLAVQLPTLSCEADGDAPLAPTEPTIVHSKHVPVVILHAVEDAGWLCFCRVKTNKAWGRGHISWGPTHG